MQEAETKRAVQEAVHLLGGRLDTLVNNAGKAKGPALCAIPLTWAV